MIISFTGAQSTGKSTLLRKCKEEFGDRFEYYPEITRQIKNTCGVNINENCNDLTQHLIIGKHIENTLTAKKSGKDCIFDRCVIDGYVYTKWLYFNKHVSQEPYNSMRSVFLELINEIDLIFYTDPADVELVDDGERSANKQFRDDIIMQFEKCIDYFRLTNVVKLSGSVEERMNTIKETLKRKGIKL